MKFFLEYYIDFIIYCFGLNVSIYALIWYWIRMASHPFHKAELEEASWVDIDCGKTR